MSTLSKNLQAIQKESKDIIKESWRMYWLPLTWACKKIKNMFR